jgi:hypothetical protein
VHAWALAPGQYLHLHSSERSRLETVIHVRDSANAYPRSNQLDWPNTMSIDVVAGVLHTPCESCDGLRQESAALPHRLQPLLMKLGMLEKAFLDSSMLHVNVLVPIAIGVGTTVVITGDVIWAFVSVPFHNYWYSIPFLVAALLSSVFIGGQWRYGPCVGEVQPFKVLVPYSVAMLTATEVMMVLGPPDKVPLGGVLQTTAYCACITVCANMGLALCPLPHQRPLQPMRGIMPIVVRTVVMTARVMDTWTDMGLLRTMFEVVRVPLGTI